MTSDEAHELFSELEDTTDNGRWDHQEIANYSTGEKNYQLLKRVLLKLIEMTDAVRDLKPAEKPRPVARSKRCITGEYPPENFRWSDTRPTKS